MLNLKPAVPIGFWLAVVFFVGSLYSENTLGRETLEKAKSFSKGIENRYHGLPGNKVAVERVEGILKESGNPWGAISYEEPVFVPGAAKINILGEDISINTLMPNFVDLCNFDEADFESRVIYLKDGDLRHADGLDLKGAIILLDSEVDLYQNLMTLGVSGFLFMADERGALKTKIVLKSPAAIARYRLGRKEGLKIISAYEKSGPVPCRIQAEQNTWQKKELKNLWCFVEGRDASLKNNYYIIQANLDTLNITPELPSGGMATLNLFATLELLKKYTKSPAKYPILFQFHNSSINNHSGASHHVHYALANKNIIFDKDPDVDNEERVSLDTIKRAEFLLNEYEKVSPEKLNQEAVDYLISSFGKPAGKNITVVKLMTKSLSYDQFLLEKKRIAQYEEDKGNKVVLDELEAAMSRIGRLVDLFKKYGMGKSLKDMTPADLKLLEDYRQKLLKRWGNDIARSKERLAKYDEVRELRKVLGERKPLLALHISLDYTSKYLGLFAKSLSWTKKKYVNSVKKMKPFSARLGKYLQEAVLKDMPRTHWEEEGSQYAGREGLESRFNGVWLNGPIYFRLGCHGYTFLNAYSSSSKKMSIEDNLEAIDADLVQNNLVVVEAALEYLLNTSKVHKYIIYPRANFKHGGVSGFIETRVKDGASLVAPETVLSDGLIVVGRQNRTYSFAGGIAPYRLYFSDNMGRALFHGVPQKYSNTHSQSAVDTPTQLFHFDKNNQINMALDFGKSSKKFNSHLQEINTFVRSHLLAGVEVRKADLYELLDPEKMKTILKVEFMPGTRGRMQDYSYSIRDKGLSTAQIRNTFMNQPLSVFFPHGERARLIFNPSGSVINTNGGSADEDPGYTIEEIHRKSLVELMGRDVAILNKMRKDRLEAHSVTNTLFDKFQIFYDRYIQGFDGEPSLAQLKADKKHKEVKQRLRMAMATAYTEYPLIKNTQTDMIKAVVFYLAVLIPFCFFMQNLVFNFKRIEHQIFGFLGLFLFTYFVFYNIHPAFQIARTPQVILIAFVSLVLVGFVMSILKGKFDYHMSDIAGKTSFGEESNVLKLSGKAIMVGVSNMRRRKIRTTLTCLTIVVITFTMLSFTSVTQSVSPTLVYKDSHAPYNGIYLSHLTWGHLSREHAEGMLDLLGSDANVKVLERYTDIGGANSTADFFWLEKDEKIDVTGTLSLMVAEDGWLGKMPMVAGRYFSADDAMEIVITKYMAEKRFHYDFTNEKPGQELRTKIHLQFSDQVYTVVGIVDGDKLREFKTPRGTSILPMQSSKRGSSFEESDQELPEGAFYPLDDDRYLIMPYKSSVGKLRSLSIRFDSAQTTWEKVLNLSTMTKNRFYFSCKEPFNISEKGKKEIYEESGRFYLKSGFETSIGGFLALLIPLIISASIIFNTMLSSVYERKKEIAIYNSIGLNPIHIGLFFIAEAFAYGVIGSVGGYLIGQLFSEFVTAMGWFADLNINYSSLSVVYVILFTIFIVVASSLYPAYMAVKMATSSSGESPLEPKNDRELELVFPFSFSEKMLTAVSAYLKEYMDIHMDTSVGDFMAVLDGPPEKSGEGDDLKISFTYQVSLAPFDLGVTEKVTFASFYEKKVGAHMIRLMVTRETGQESNWLATNRPFCNRLRKYLLHWRAMNEEKHEEFLRGGLEWFQLEGSAEKVV